MLTVALQYDLSSIVIAPISVHSEQLCLVLNLAHFGKQIRNTWKGLKFCAGEGWRSVGPIVRET
jgi:hypothetical protein